MPRATAAPSNDDFVAALTKTLDNIPRPLKGTPAAGAIFTGPKKDVMAQKALTERWVEEVSPPEQATQSRKTRTQVIYASITAHGRQWVLEQGSPLRIAESLRDALATCGAELNTCVSTTQAGLTSMNRELTRLQQTLTEVVDRYNQTAQSLRVVLDQAKTGAQPEPNWLDEVVRIVSARKQQSSTTRPTLPQIYDELKRAHPLLTLSQFHDGLRTLHQKKRIILGAYTLALATLPDHLNALYLDKEVKFYVDLP
jgi:hypothetical protein